MSFLVQINNTVYQEILKAVLNLYFDNIITDRFNTCLLDIAIHFIQALINKKDPYKYENTRKKHLLQIIINIVEKR